MPDNTPPPDIVEGDAKVRKWIREQEDKVARPRVESAFERFKRARDIDQSKMPPWRDPRGAA